MTTNLVNTASALVDHAAGKDDRWLMLAVLFVLIACLGLGIRWLASQYASTAAKLGGVIEANTEALREVKETVAWCRQYGGGPQR